MSGKRDRPRGLQIDQKTLEYKELPKDQQQQSRKSTPEEIAQRKIFKIKGLNQESQGSSSKPKFSLFSINDKSENNNSQSKANGQAEDQDNDKNQSENKDESKDNKEKNKQQPPTPFFGNTFTNPFKYQGSGNGLGIFGASKLSDNKPVLGEGLFSKKSSDSGSGSGSIFKSTFGNPQNIFSFKTQGVPPIRKQNNTQPRIESNNANDDEGDSGQLEQQQNVEIDPKKSSGKYEYPKQGQILFSKAALKLKKLLQMKKGETSNKDNKNQLISNVEVILQKDTDKQILWLIVKTGATKVNIISGIVSKAICDVKHFQNSRKNISISILKPIAVKSEQKQKFDKYALKIQFQQEDIGSQFQNCILEQFANKY